ncbi:uncharacterized protein PgNI_06946 [Pyricularia grisea]|uniref:Uncharacterized protein n=1 Tax=Pyricularia grisea TaxID=148305 RepID=A0A6P8B3A2_PYRGI|nr:uncharacterized protein PgNI_06946 [Pyricularia grisea]TLD09289.1 hypothetical protein PgNI_06946 [Pyricularia grisea]
MTYEIHTQCIYVLLRGSSHRAPWKLSAKQPAKNCID